MTDAIIGFVESNGNFVLLDMWTNGGPTNRYQDPILEDSQDFSNQTGKIEDGITTIKFSRPRNTNDHQAQLSPEIVDAKIVYTNFLEANFEYFRLISARGNVNNLNCPSSFLDFGL